MQFFRRSTPLQGPQRALGCTLERRTHPDGQTFFLRGFLPGCSYVTGVLQAVPDLQVLWLRDAWWSALSPARQAQVLAQLGKLPVQLPEDGLYVLSE